MERDAADTLANPLPGWVGSVLVTIAWIAATGVAVLVILACLSLVGPPDHLLDPTGAGTPLDAPGGAFFRRSG